MAEFDVEFFLLVIEVAPGVHPHLHGRAREVLEEEAAGLVGFGAMVTAASREDRAVAAAAAAASPTSLIAAVAAIAVGALIVAPADGPQDHVRLGDRLAALVADESGGFETWAEPDVGHQELLLLRDREGVRPALCVHLGQHRDRELRGARDRDVWEDVIAVAVGADWWQEVVAVALPTQRVATRW